jgi:predicted nucleotidyltransferase
MGSGDKSPGDVRARYERALDALVGKLKQDRTVLAAVLGGSLSHDEVWEKSDIDLWIIGDETHKERSFCLAEEGVAIHAIVTPRSNFKKSMERALAGSFLHSFLSKSRVLYSHDDAIPRLFDDLQTVGARDRAAQLLAYASAVLPALAKAQKWLAVKQDAHYAFVWTLYCVDALAKVEVTAAGEVVGREAVHQALRRNPELFGRLYTGLIDGPKTLEAVGEAVAAIDGYLEERAHTLFAAVFDFLAEAGGPRSMGEIDAHFKNAAPGAMLSFACEWLADKGLIEAAEAPLRLSDKSRIAVTEAAYYYDGEEGSF